MPGDPFIAESLVEHFLDLYVEEVWAGSAEWASYRRVASEVASVTLRSAREAARRMGISVHVDIVPDDYDGASVKPIQGHVVIRVGDAPAPWEAL